MKNWRKWALNGILCMMAVMTLADLAGFGRKGGGLDTQAEDSAGITPLKGSTGLIETVGEILAAGGQTAEEEKILGGASLTLLANVEGKQSLSAVIQTKEGSLIVVDGGTVADADHLTDVLASKGGHVKAWLITHPHDDHIGALNTILAREEKRITIDKVYYNFAPVTHYEKDAPPDDITLVKNFIYNLETKLPEEKRDNKITKGTQIQVDDVTITVLNRAMKLPVDTINNSSVCYMINVNGVYIDFLGDLGREGGEELIRMWDTEELKCDILQMAHHGQNGVTEQVYRIFRPKICLWPTPQWLWDNDGGDGPDTGDYKIGKTKQWMIDLGVEKHYCTKDGDQVIQ